MASPRVKYIGNIPVNIDDLATTLESPIPIPAVVAGSVPFEFVLRKVDSSRPVLSLFQAALIPVAAVTKDTTNYVTINLINRGTDGTGTDVIASLNTNAASGTVPAYTETLMTVDYTKAAIKPGSVLTLSITKTGTGQNIPYGAIILRFNQ